MSQHVLLALAERLPHGDAEDYVRRCVCELVDGDHGSHSTRVLTLRRSLVYLEHERRHGLRRTQQRGAPAIDRVMAALRQGP
jgi:hypothetical protein